IEREAGDRTVELGQLRIRERPLAEERGADARLAGAELPGKSAGRAIELRLLVDEREHERGIGRRRCANGDVVAHRRSPRKSDSQRSPSFKSACGTTLSGRCSRAWRAAIKTSLRNGSLAGTRCVPCRSNSPPISASSCAALMSSKRSSSLTAAA